MFCQIMVTSPELFVYIFCFVVVFTSIDLICYYLNIYRPDLILCIPVEQDFHSLEAVTTSSGPILPD